MVHDERTTANGMEPERETPTEGKNVLTRRDGRADGGDLSAGADGGYEEVRPAERKTLDERFSAALRASLIARFLFFFGALEVRVKNSVFFGKISAFFKNGALSRKLFLPAKQFLSKEIAESFLLGAIDRFFSMLLRLPLRAYGAFILVFAGGASVVESLKNYFSGASLFTLSGGIASGIALLLSLILLSSSRSRSAGKALCESRIASYLLFRLLGLRKNAFEDAAVCDVNYAAVLITAIVFSAATVFWRPLTLLVICVAVFFVRLSFCSPEGGLIAFFLCMPFVSGRACLFMTLAVAIGYGVKLLRGKRVFRSSFFGFFMLLFAFLALFGTLLTTSSGGVSFTTYFAVICLFVLSLMMMDNRDLIKRAAAAISLSAVICAVWISVMFAAWYLPTEYKSIVTAITRFKIPTGLQSDRSAGILIGLACPLLIARYRGTQRLARRVWTVVGVVVLIIGAIVSQSPCAWIAVAASLILWRIFNKKIVLIPAAVLTAVLITVYVAVIPTFITNYVSAFSTGFPVFPASVWNSFAESASHFFMGVGEGGVPTGGNLLTHLLCANGIAGVLLLLFAILGFFAFSCYAVQKNAGVSSRLRKIAFGLIASAVSFLIVGVFVDPFEDPKLLSLFFSVLGMIPACGRVMLREYEERLQFSDYVVAIPKEQGGKKKKRGRSDKSASTRVGRKRRGADAEESDVKVLSTGTEQEETQ